MKLLLVATLLTATSYSWAQQEAFPQEEEAAVTQPAASTKPDVTRPGLPRKVAQQATDVEPTVKADAPKPPVGTMTKPPAETVPVKKPETKKIETKKVEETKVPAAKAVETTTTEATTTGETEAAKVEEEPVVVEETKKTKTVKKEVKPVEMESRNEHFFGFHGDVNIPHILNYGLDYWHSSRWFSVAANLGGYAAKKIGKSDSDPEGVDIKISNQDFALRLHPFQGAFYIGAMYGSHKIEGKKTATYSVSGQSRTTTITDTIKANYVTPHIGWLFKSSFGLTWGFDLGYMTPSGVKTTIDEGDIVNDPLYPTLAQQPEYVQNKADLIKQSDDIGGKSLPFITVIRLGWMF